MEQTFFVFGHHVQPYGKIGRTILKFGRTMSDDRLLFLALEIRIAGLENMAARQRSRYESTGEGITKNYGLF